jgi:hypothetical protein
MPQWDYRKIDLNDLPRSKEDIDLLTNAGDDGWELVVITPNNFAYLKRPVEALSRAQEAAQPARTTRRKAQTSAK